MIFSFKIQIQDNFGTDLGTSLEIRMSELTQKLKNQGWTNSCDCQHALHLHCHNQILKSADEIHCQSCDKEMSGSASN